MNRNIMILKYGLDEGKTYQEQNTLLEPNNFIPSWEAGDEEKKEVSNALRKLREKYDSIRRHVSKQEYDLEMIKKDVEKLGEEERRVEKETTGMGTETVHTKKEYERVTLEHDFERMY